MRKIQSLEVANDTLTVFVSDNGPHAEGGHNVKFFNSSGGLRGHKRSLYEGGVRSPSIVSITASKVFKAWTSAFPC